MLIQEATAAAHPLAGTVARWVWLLPILPLLGFVINGLISLVSTARIGPPDPDMGHGDDTRAGHGTTGGDHPSDKPHPYAGIVSIIGPAVVVLSFVLALAIFFAMKGVSMETPFIQRYFNWMPVGKLQIDAALHDDVEADVGGVVLDVDLDAFGERAAEEARQLADGRLLHGDDAIRGAGGLAGELGDDLVGHRDSAAEARRRERDVEVRGRHDVRTPRLRTPGR